jgi:hypothetical protein
MDVYIAFPADQMCDSFVRAATAMGYNVTVNGLAVTFEFSSPRAPQPPRDADVQASTSDYEALVGRGLSTLFDISAISGAAISPLMGSATRQAYRILLTATNVRLGVWLPHPEVVREARRQINEQAADRHGQPGRRWARPPLLLLLWYLSPHPFWRRNKGRNADREARLWAMSSISGTAANSPGRSGTG